MSGSWTFFLPDKNLIDLFRLLSISREITYETNSRAIITLAIRFRKRAVKAAAATFRAVAQAGRNEF